MKEKRFSDCPTRFRRTNYPINHPACHSPSKIPAPVNGLNAIFPRTIRPLSGNVATSSRIRWQHCLINRRTVRESRQKCTISQRHGRGVLLDPECVTRRHSRAPKMPTWAGSSAISGFTTSGSPRRRGRRRWRLFYRAWRRNAGSRLPRRTRAYALWCSSARPRWSERPVAAEAAPTASLRDRYGN